ncbi:BolA family protein [Marinobacter salicampi]|uniref:BolA family protein n=1 Tax=Marinobacter salicampi TaxID=435907 RepID=UPI001407EDA3|nr:BolA/IbaG family iron-sulfur metabolism protein [Marinobacter salicampi]
MSIKTSIEQKLAEQYRPVHLTVENESHMHNVPPNSETHFKVTLVTEAFKGTGKVKRHQGIYQALAEELAGEVHALALHTYSPEEWAARQGTAPDSPQCMGGSKHDRASEA